ncbi:MAG: sigma-54 interaction domain-containing protein [Bacteroidota bacterium]|jgi:transcriptional regulator with GAF, ATPase, and Fis domain|nr:sigma-54-dependent Fis family transcriptional regulator [Ignavibacteria bacterium]HEX2962560.1 sigma-54 dependent transcriptional regulator [Ignavibacteriales bacterium]MCU7500139.1 sigma-54-dependent Fis family transcriptional regulator [Ignavibacteria bacterium]MCU7511526.1 sigma-54-dependent Fis family transcriptional regulator [Ignavibacteria bacterium]MCU7521031.1 sigma-54-dependent Fis family transcriptional regulator [Ignavibacteria bacterium]
MTISQFQEKFGIIGKSKEIRDLVDIIMQVAQSDISVLIFGESGVGKEVFARAIHGYSKRADKPLVTVNCGAIPEGILESELFGHRKGSFTGAVDNRKGYFEIADGGTLFLDELAEMPLTTQVKLLRAIENKEFMRIGSETVTQVDVRIVAATNKDLQKEVDAKRFREDLYFRLKAVTLYIPPLRKRREDISELALHFIKMYSEANNLPQPHITNEALDLLTNFPWTGNIRELKNSIETAIALNRTGMLDVQSFSFLLKSRSEERENRNLPVFIHRTPEESDREMIYRALIDIKRDLMELKQVVYKNYQEIHEKDNNNSHINVDEVVPIEVMEKEAIRNALHYSKGNKKEAAKLLKISERTLYRKMQEYDL